MDEARRRTIDLRGKIPGPCRVRRVRIPKTRDPFINTHLLALGPDADGRDRFWTSSCNMVQGTTCVIINEDGDHQTFLPWVPHWSFYGAVQEDAHTLWLCNRMSQVVRFSISTGRFESFETDAPPAHVGQGMAFDPATKKLFVAGFDPPHPVAASFDTRGKRRAKSASTSRRAGVQASKSCPISRRCRADRSQTVRASPAKASTSMADAWPELPAHSNPCSHAT